MVIWGLEYCRLLALGLGWLEALQWRPPTLPTQFSRSAFGFGNLVPFESSLRWCALFWICGPRLLNVATGGVWDLSVLLPTILGCWLFFARAFLLGRLVYFLKILNNKNFYKFCSTVLIKVKIKDYEFLDFYRRFRVLLTTRNLIELS